MATFDISRVSFNPFNHFKSVRMQQGRVSTDDDWNENERIENDDRHRTIVDIIGGYGTPDDGFSIDTLSAAGGLLNFNIGAGTIYLGGLRLEMDVAETFQVQSDWLQQHDFPVPAGLAAGDVHYDLVYLEAWQQPVCAAEDEELFEVALGGPDTTTRLKNMRRVKIFDAANATDCPTYWQALKDSWTADSLGTIGDNFERVPAVTLKVSFANAQPTDNLCEPTLTGAYLGAENQAIRVQITQDPLTKAIGFTWGFDNASPYYKVTVTGNTVTMDTLPKDQYHWPLTGQIVEILPLAAVLPNKQKIAGLSGELKRVGPGYDPDLTTFKIDSAVTTLGNPPYYFMRVWNRGADIASPIQIPIPAPGGTAVLGNTGLQISFTGTDLVPHDFWVIAARPDKPGEIVPWALTDTGIAPVGVKRFYAPLGIIRWTGAAAGPTVDLVYDCRRHFRPLTDQECCCTYTVGDGVYSKGDFNSIEKAVAALPANGGKICVLPGYHHANVRITGRNNIQIYGCGEQSVVRPRTDDKGLISPIFFISSSQSVSICHLTLVTIDGMAIDLEDPGEQAPASSGITISHNRIMAAVHAVRIVAWNNLKGANDIYIHHNLISMLNLETGKAAIYSQADEVFIERNRIVLVPAGEQGGGDGGDNPQGPGDWGDCCHHAKRYYGRIVDFQTSISKVFMYTLAYRAFSVTYDYLAQGGIQIAGTSEKVRVLENSVTGGWGNGITLGNLPDVVNPNDGAMMEIGQIVPFLYKISIEGNEIYQMGSSGIGVVAFSDTQEKSFLVTVADLTICRNYITQCALPNHQKNNLLDFGAVWGGITLGAIYEGFIQNNRIEHNGITNDQGTAGLFILTGSQIDIRDNHIVGNGSKGGVVIRAAFAAKPTALPAVRLHQNTVSQPVGKALAIIALGPISIVGNQFCTGGIAGLAAGELDLGSTVSILNLGVSKDMLRTVKKPSFKSVYGLSLGGMSKATNTSNAKLMMPNGKILFTDNQVTLSFAANDRSRTLSSVFILTLGDLGFNDNQLECTTLLPQTTIVLLDAIAVGSTVRTNDNRFEENTTRTLASLLSVGALNIATGNESTYCLFPVGNPGLVKGDNLVWIDPTNESCADKNLRTLMAELLRSF